MRELREMIADLFKKEIEVFKEHGIPEEESIDGVHTGMDILKKLHLTALPEIDVIVTTIEDEVDKLDPRKNKGAKS